jgi:Expansin C-terminal domain
MAKVTSPMSNKGSSGEWIPLKQSWGKIWRLDCSHPLQRPFSIRLTTLTGRTRVVNNAIPADWKPSTVYEFDVNFSIRVKKKFYDETRICAMYM